MTATVFEDRNAEAPEYIIRVQRGPLPEKTWHIYKRYNDFVSLHNLLQISGLNFPLPPKKLIGNMEREFIAERQTGLQNYLNLILMNPILASSLPVKKFLDPENYATPFQELALQHVSMILRSEVNYEVIKPVPEIGWRLRKHYFLVKSRVNPKEEMLLSWVEHGPDKYLEDRDLHGVFKSISGLQHPYIQGIEFLNCNEVGGFVVRGLNNAGSLRDLLCTAKPKLQFMKKYGNPKQYKPLSPSDMACFGRQILEVLRFLSEKGLPFGHLHTGNIMLENGEVKLLDIENGVLGLPSYYRPYFVQHKKIQTLEAVDVYCFGHVLYEMAFGHPLHESVCDIFPSSCPPVLKSVLESILSTEACKGGLPTIAALLTHPFFNSTELAYSHHLTNPSQSDRPHLKFSSHVKEALKVARQKIEIRLKDEQKMVRHQKRLVRVQELLSNEEEKKKRKQKQKEQLQKQHQQLVSNGKSPERSESPNSTSTATSAGTVTPPSGNCLIEFSPPPPPPVPSAPSPLQSVPSAAPERTALLGSICNFNKATLRRTAATASASNLNQGCILP
ncbi:PX domain-containing protein kinase-like protein isoform X3 [Zootermopsis nevadensis]|uniref:PX domain-containing protein kinase-like protein isoform X3 n=1 Tax=Zootermopsis nevadensis TaxID=136037 RepID=UPI000B8E39AC|nr:PX domain-containing protein kinase-like protein isoform X3 [Zootermopsis nevadensis]